MFCPKYSYWSDGHYEDVYCFNSITPCTLNEVFISRPLSLQSLHGSKLSNVLHSTFWLFLKLLTFMPFIRYVNVATRYIWMLFWSWVYKIIMVFLCNILSWLMIMIIIINYSTFYNIQFVVYSTIYLDRLPQ